MLAVKNGYSFKYVPKEYITSKMCEVAIEKNYSNIDIVPENLKTSELYMLAVYNGYKFEYVPYKYRPYEMNFVDE